jgi:hypothetical protein
LRIENETQDFAQVVRDLPTRKWCSHSNLGDVSRLLFNHAPPSSRPILFRGPVGQNNAVKISPSKETDVTCEIRDLSWPVVRDVPTRNIPPVTDELYQVIVELHRVGPAGVPIYHRGSQPMLKVGVRFGEPLEEDAANPSADLYDTSGELVGWYDEDSIQDGMLVFKVPMPERVINLDVPEQWLYAEDVNKLVQSCTFLKGGQDDIRFVLKRQKGKHAYIYQASFVLQY